MCLILFSAYHLLILLDGPSPCIKETVKNHPLFNSHPLDMLGSQNREQHRDAWSLELLGLISQGMSAGVCPWTPCVSVFPIVSLEEMLSPYPFYSLFANMGDGAGGS